MPWSVDKLTGHRRWISKHNREAQPSRRALLKRALHGLFRRQTAEGKTFVTVRDPDIYLNSSPAKRDARYRANVEAARKREARHARAA